MVTTRSLMAEVVRALAVLALVFLRRRVRPLP
jgi:hypothetical protein